MSRELGELVCSEVHTFSSAAVEERETGKDGLRIATFRFSLPRSLINIATPTKDAEYDSDGDLVVVRREAEREEVVRVEHLLATPLQEVGRQVWRGSLLLADYILHHHSHLKDKRILEVGAGTGIASIVAAFCGARVTATDIPNDGILEQIRRNVARNSHLIPPAGSVRVASLDFANDTSMIDDEHFDLMLAGDVIYDDDITLNFVRFIERVAAISTFKDTSVSIVISMEKRYVFTLSDLDTVAPAFDFFLEELEQLRQRQSRMSLEFLEADFPQYFCYERSAEMVLLMLSFGKK